MSDGTAEAAGAADGMREVYGLGDTAWCAVVLPGSPPFVHIQSGQVIMSRCDGGYAVVVQAGESPAVFGSPYKTKAAAVAKVLECLYAERAKLDELIAKYDLEVTA